ncbi:MAG: Hsp20/alpha crystallin family protein [Desulfobacterales bacterium]|nr:Hsp20/alpha crystallin family protein [Desulfobacterales bacterium]
MILNRLFDIDWATFPWESWRELAQKTAGVYPLINISEDKNNYTVKAEIPGVKNEDIDITVTGKNVAIAGERKIKIENARYHRKEREGGKFNRIFTLPNEVDTAKVEAILKDGILTIILPKTEAVKPRQISIK